MLVLLCDSALNTFIVLFARMQKMGMQKLNYFAWYETFYIDT